MMDTELSGLEKYKMGSDNWCQEAFVKNSELINWCE